MFDGCYGVVRCLAVKSVSGKDGKVANSAPTDPHGPGQLPQWSSEDTVAVGYPNMTRP